VHLETSIAFAFGQNPPGRNLCQIAILASAIGPVAIAKCNDESRVLRKSAGRDVEGALFRSRLRKDLPL